MLYSVPASKAFSKGWKTRRPTLHFKNGNCAHDILTSSNEGKKLVGMEGVLNTLLSFPKFRRMHFCLTIFI